MTLEPRAANKFCVGLTGGIGSGKSTVATLFEQCGAAIVDTDVIAHQLTAPGGLAMPAIRAAFGNDIIAASGAMDRAKMRETVFADPSAKVRLEAILHPLIRQEATRAANAAQAPYVIFAVPLLVESGNWVQRVDRVLVVDCDEERQIQRVMQRNALSREQVLAIMASQATRAARLAAADDVIVNNGSEADLRHKVEQLHARYRALAASVQTK